MKKNTYSHHEKVNPKTLIVDLLYKEELRVSRLFLVLSFLLSFALLFYSSINFSCILSLTQNLFLPFLIVKDVLSYYDLKGQYEKMKAGFIVGVIAGLIPATTINIVSMIQYYLLGNRSTAYSALGMNPPDMSLEVLYTEIGTQVIIGFGLVLLSALAGVVSSLMVRKK